MTDAKNDGMNPKVKLAACLCSTVTSAFVLAAVFNAFTDSPSPVVQNTAPTQQCKETQLPNKGSEGASTNKNTQILNAPQCK